MNFGTLNRQGGQRRLNVAITRARQGLHVCFKIITSMMSAKHFKCDLFHFRYLFKIRYNSLRCVIVFVVRKQLL